MLQVSRALFIPESNSALMLMGGELSTGAGNAGVCHCPLEQPRRGEKERAALSQQTAANWQMAGEEKKLLYVE